MKISIAPTRRHIDVSRTIMLASDVSRHLSAIVERRIGANLRSRFDGSFSGVAKLYILSLHFTATLITTNSLERLVGLARVGRRRVLFVRYGRLDTPEHSLLACSSRM